MTTTHRNLDGYGAPAIEWARVKAVLDSQLTQAPGSGGPQRHTTWLTTINPDGSPHVMPLGWFSAAAAGTSLPGRATRKSRNLSRDPRCVVSVATDPFDLVIEGAAEACYRCERIRLSSQMLLSVRMASRGRGRRPHGRVQCPVGRSGAVVCLSREAVDGVRTRHVGTVRRHEVSPGLSEPAP